MLQPKFSPRHRILPFLQIQITPVRGETAVPIDEGMVGVGGVVHVVRILDELCRQSVSTCDEIAVHIGAVSLYPVEQ